MALSTTGIIIFLIIFAMHSSLFTIGGIVLLLHRKEQHDRSRIFLGTFMLFMSFCILAFMIEGLLISGGFTEFFRRSLPAYPMIFSFFVWMLMPCYLIEILRPYMLTRRRLLRAIWPQLAIFVGFIVWHATQGFADYTPIYTFTDIFNNINKVDVIFRLLLVGLYFFTAFIVLFISKDLRFSNAPQPWHNILGVLCCFFSVTFIFGMIIRNPLFMVLHYLILDTFCLIALYMEFRVRIPVPQNLAQESINQAASNANDNCPQELIDNLQQHLDTNFWKNPDLQQNELCRVLCTNRTYLASAIRTLGYANYTDMINQLRAQYVHRTLKKNPNVHLPDLFFEAGFRSRSTANRAFQQLYGCTPYVFQNELQAKIVVS